MSLDSAGCGLRVRGLGFRLPGLPYRLSKERSKEGRKGTSEYALRCRIGVGVLCFGHDIMLVRQIRAAIAATMGAIKTVTVTLHVPVPEIFRQKSGFQAPL